jgi:hypothetical protein
VAVAQVCHSDVSLRLGRRASTLRFLLAKRERKDLDAEIKEFNLKGHVFDLPLLPDELIHPRLLNLACAIGAGIGSMMVAGCCAIQLHLEANGRPVLRRAQDQMEVAAVEPRHNLAGRRFEGAILGTDGSTIRRVPTDLVRASAVGCRSFVSPGLSAPATRSSPPERSRRRFRAIAHLRSVAPQHRQPLYAPCSRPDQLPHFL